ncbi:hypothetical protein STEG23_035822, partial [Scotinomys teguina]
WSPPISRGQEKRREGEKGKEDKKINSHCVYMRTFITLMRVKKSSLETGLVLLLLHLQGQLYWIAQKWHRGHSPECCSSCLSNVMVMPHAEHLILSELGSNEESGLVSDWRGKKLWMLVKCPSPNVSHLELFMDIRLHSLGNSNCRLLTIKPEESYSDIAKWMVAEVETVQTHPEALSEALPGSNVAFDVTGVSVKDVSHDNIAGYSRNEPLIEAAGSTAQASPCVESIFDFPPLGHFAAHDMSQTVAMGVIKAVEKKAARVGKVIQTASLILSFCEDACGPKLNVCHKTETTIPWKIVTTVLFSDLKQNLDPDFYYNVIKA